MSAFTVIAGVTRTLAGLLNGATGVTVEFDKSPADNISDAQSLIHLYLYRIEHNPFFRTVDWVRPTETTQQASPIGLNLFYLITPYGNGQEQIQMTLGEVVKVLHDNGVVSPSAFDPVLADTTEELRVVPHSLSLDEMTGFWRSFENRSYRLSVTYEVSVALIDSDVTRTVAPVAERHVVIEQLR
ncbi:MAG TPA: DUF4255 domain-containing protein [Longimicrobiales bacterium]